MTVVDVELLYHVPRSQVWRGSRGRQEGHVHVHVLEPFRHGRLRRVAGAALCGRRGWYERQPEGVEALDLCPRCVAMAARHDLEVPSVTNPEVRRL